MASAEQEECAHRSTEDIVQLPYEILTGIFRTLPMSVVVHRVGAVCKDWNAIAKDDELWRLRCGLSELPSGFSSWFAYAQRETMREQTLDHLYERAGLTHNCRKGLQLLSVLADAGDDYAMALYGWVLRNGVGVVQDEFRGTQLVQLSNHSMARAWCLLCGIGVPPDRNASFRMLDTECDSSDPHVQYTFAYCHHWGYGCVRDNAQALQCYERAGNHLGALNSLGYMYDYGFGVERDQARAVVLYRHAAEQGYRIAQHRIARMYREGKGVPMDLQQSNHWNTLAAEQGSR